MRILLLTNYYGRMPGGALAMAEVTHRLMQDAGHEVVPFAISNDKAHRSEWQEYWPSAMDMRSQLLPVADALETPYSFPARRKLRRLLEVARPDVAHLHNPYGIMTLSVLDALKECQIPVVLTLHEYRSICPNGWLATHDGICHRCVDGTAFNAVIHRCVDGSFTKSAIAAAETIIYRRRKQFDKVDLMLAPSEFLRDQVVAGGLEADRIRIVRNPAKQTAKPTRRPSTPARFIFFGRLVQNKGIHVLLSASKLLEGDAEVVIFGAGPLEPDIVKRIEEERLPVSFLGYGDRETISRELATTTAAILPSLWYENAPMSIVEAAAHGVPTIGSSIGAIPEMIEHGRTGLTISPDDPPALARAMDALALDPAHALDLGLRAWERVRRRHDPDTYVSELTAAFEEVRGVAVPVHGAI